jgi:hypothetical protein
LQPGQLLTEFLGVVAHRTRGVVRLIGIYSQMIHGFLDGSAFVISEPIGARRGVLTPIWRPVELHIDDAVCANCVRVVAESGWTSADVDAVRLYVGMIANARVSGVA